MAQQFSRGAYEQAYRSDVDGRLGRPDPHFSSAASIAVSQPRNPVGGGPPLFAVCRGERSVVRLWHAGVITAQPLSRCRQVHTPLSHSNAVRRRRSGRRPGLIWVGPARRV